MRRLADLLGLDRFERLSALVRRDGGGDRFLRAGDVVEVSGGILGTVRSVITPPLPPGADILTSN